MAGLNTFGGITREDICMSSNVFAFLSEHHVYGSLISVSLALMLSSLVTTITADAVTPIISILCGQNLANGYIVLQEGTEAPYTTTNPATDDPSAIVLKYGLILVALLSFLFVLLFYYILTKITCIRQSPTRMQSRPAHLG